MEAKCSNCKHYRDMDATMPLMCMEPESVRIMKDSLRGKHSSSIKVRGIFMKPDEGDKCPTFAPTNSKD